MRTLSTAQQDILDSAVFSVFTRMRVANADGTIVDLSTYGDREWFNGGEMSVNVDEVVPSARLFVSRSNSTAASGSLAPLVEASTLNVDDAGSYAALLDPGAEVYWDFATLSQGSTQPATGSTEWVTLFHGEIDSVEFGGPEIEVYARDKIGALISDRWIEDTRPYGSESGVAIQTVMQDILNEWADGESLQVPTSPGFLVTAYEQSQMPVIEALRELSGLIGYDVRPEWYNTSTGFALVFQEPDRSASTTVYTFGSSQYYDVTRLDLSRENVRNVVTVKYTLSSTAGSTSALTRASYSATDSTSISRFGRRWMEIDLAEDSDIDTAIEAQALADAALSDLSTPDAEQEIEGPFFWPVMLGDYHTWSANDVHYDVDQTWAVSGYRHVLRQNQHRTFFRVRGKPQGQYMNWFRRAARHRDAVDLTYAKSLLSFRDSQDSTAGTHTFFWTRGDLVSEVWVYNKLHSQPEPADPWPADGEVPTTILYRGTDSYTANLPSTGEMRAIQFEPRTTSLESGPVKRVRLYPRVLTRVASSEDVTDGAIVASALTKAAQKFGSDIVWSATDNDTVAWTSGTITLANSSQYEISGSNTGDMGSTALRYIYLDSDASVTELQVSTASTDTTGDNKVLMAVAWKAPSTAQNAAYIPAVGILGLNGDNLSPSSVTTNTLAANSVTAAKITVANLAAISANLGTVTAGTVSANVIVASTQFTGATAFFRGGIQIGTSTGGGELTTYDLVRFRDGGAIQVEDGRILEFYDSGNTFVGDIRGSLASTGVLARGDWVFSQSTADIVYFDGGVNMSGLTTSDPAVAGELWNDSGTVKVSSG